MLFVGALFYSLLYIPCLLVGAIAFPRAEVWTGVCVALLLSWLLVALLMWTIRVYQRDWGEAIYRLTTPRGLRGLCLFIVGFLVVLCAFGSPARAIIGFVLPIGLVFLLNGMGIERHSVARIAPPVLDPTLPSTPEEPVSPTRPPSDPMIQKTFEWNHDGHPYTLTLQVRRIVYDQLRS